MGYRRPYSEEFKDKAVRLVTDMGMSYREVADDLGCSAESIRLWVRQAEVDAGDRDGVTSDERERLQAENAELKRANRRLVQEREILKAAAAFFARETNGSR
ncbi:MAG TPA: transposase [Euzebyales bacterium]|nr:transposase [Euzebyales bacterium]